MEKIYENRLKQNVIQKQTTVVSNNILFEHFNSPIPDPGRFPIHAHNKFELFFCMNGDGDYMVEGHRYPLKPGTLMVMRPGELHCPEINPNCLYDRYYVHFPIDIVKSIDSKMLLMRPFTDRPFGYGNHYNENDLDVDLISLCFKKMSEAANNPALNIQSYLYPVLQEVYKTFCNIEENPLPVVDNVINDIMEFINNNLSMDLSLKLLEEKFFINKTTLSRNFKKITGKTIWNYILNKRLILANQMLQAGEPATKSAYACGFSDYSSFYRAYTKRFNTSPSKINLRN